MKYLETTLAALGDGANFEMHLEAEIE